ncbi:hypothetical protein Ae201684P_016590 [Aphanomyces euteiches]|uniref:Uncharacterized protein n=1 Tax=Aphanomyces euteiches TaxID=100861 RepID=A0A6G0XIM7_9STRA|nr:hypothetical protein Ae201684_004537 [Aphanomyces euteiches]KAH9093971.1 hypothetical protein Ae201684P_016590 [Aphanomyces euteiches]
MFSLLITMAINPTSACDPTSLYDNPIELSNIEKALTHLPEQNWHLCSRDWIAVIAIFYVVLVHPLNLDSGASKLCLLEPTRQYKMAHYCSMYINSSRSLIG